MAVVRAAALRAVITVTMSVCTGTASKAQVTKSLVQFCRLKRASDSVT